MVGDGASHLVALAAGGGVVGAHDALHAGELHHGVRHEVGLRQVRGALGVGGVSLVQLRVGGQVLRQRHDAVGLLLHGAQRLLEHHLVQAVDVRLQRMLEVLLVEELRVGQAGAHYALVAARDGVGVRRVAVRHDDEVVGQLAVRVVQREVTLVHEHGVDDDLLGDAQELLVERAHQHRWLLAEVHNLQKRLLGQLGAGARALLGLRHALADDRLARLLARHHVRGLDDA